MQNESTASSIIGFKSIGNFQRNQVVDLVTRTCAQIGKPWERLNEREKNIYLTVGANTLANRPTLLGQTADTPNLDAADLIQFQHVLSKNMRQLPGWTDDKYFDGLPVDGVGTGTGYVETQVESRR